MTGAGNRFLIVSLCGVRHAIDLGDISEVTEKYRTSPIPRTPLCYLGAFNFHGHPVPVVDLASYLHGDAPRKDGVVLVLDHRIGTLALRVDSVDRIVYDCGVVESEVDGDGPRVLSLSVNDEIIGVLELELLVERLEDELWQGWGSILRQSASGVCRE